MRIFKLILAALFVAFMAALTLTANGSTPPITDSAGVTIPGSIAQFRTIKLGGIDQRILIRGRSTNNPILLLLHGGPGAPEYAMYREHNGALEDHFTLVHLEQRGAGRSFHDSLTAADMSIEKFLSDVHELVLQLKAEFHQEKIFILGHSWGTVLGTLYTRDHAENVAAYIGQGQVAWLMEGEDRSYDFVMREATKANDAEAIATLTRIGRPPYTVSELIEQRQLVTQYGGASVDRASATDVILGMLNQPEFAWLDLYYLLRGVFFSLDTMWDPLMQVNLMKDATDLKVPVYFALGRHDHQVPADLAAEYFAQLKAPAKHLVWFENSAHTPSAEEPELFNKMMIEQVLPLR